MGTVLRRDNAVAMFHELCGAAFRFRLAKRSKLHLSAGGVIAVVAITMTTTAENTF